MFNDQSLILQLRAISNLDFCMKQLWVLLHDTDKISLKTGEYVKEPKNLYLKWQCLSLCKLILVHYNILITIN